VSELAISFVVYVCVTGGALAGIYLNPVLPPEHVKDETRQAVNIAVGIIATLAALVLGLMVTSAKSSFDTRASDVREIAARIIILDRVLRDYGHEATDARSTEDDGRGTHGAFLGRGVSGCRSAATHRHGIGLSPSAPVAVTRERHAKMASGPRALGSG